MRKTLVAALTLTLCIGFLLGQAFSQPAPETVLPLRVLIDIIHEASGDLALQNEIVISGMHRNRQPEEYASVYFETDFIMKKLKEYGIRNAEIVNLPTESATTWDAEMAELWITKPELRKIADLKEVAASLSRGSSSTDVTAELVYVGPGNRESFYEGRDIKDKIVLVRGFPDSARRLAVDKFAALGLVAYASSHPDFDPDQVGWSSIHASEKDKPTFAFMISTRLGEELRNLLERGQKIEVRAVSKTQDVPYKEQMVSALLPGKDYPEEELVFTAHVFEGLTMEGANDNDSGCAALLETARVIKNLVDKGKIPPLRRSIRFLFIPEISGTAAYIKAYPEIAKRFFANINEDMVGEALIKNRSFFTLECSPHSLPSYLGDVLQSIVEWVGATQNESGWDSENSLSPAILSPTGTRDPFYYSIVPYGGGSDHIVFLDGGVRVPAVTFNCWPDMWYHTASDTPDKSDSTQLKRVVFISVAGAAFLANAGGAETLKIIAETSGRALGRLGQEKLSAEKMIMGAGLKGVDEAFKESLNIIHQAIDREKQALASIRFFIREDAALEGHLQARIKGVEDLRIPSLGEIEEAYKLRCLQDHLKPKKPLLSQEEIRLNRLVPVRAEKMRGYFNAWEFYQQLRELKDLPKYQLGRADYEVRNFIDGKRSILEIRNAVSAEYGPVSLQNVENYMLVLEKTGFIKIQKKEK